MVKLKRIYDQYSPEDGYRVFVDRLWARGLSKKDAHIDLWLKDIAPSNELRKWFGHDPEKWPEFQKKYVTELKANPATKILKDKIKENEVVTLLYGARDTIHNEALVIQHYL